MEVSTLQTRGFYDKYKSVYYEFGAEKTATLAFCELFTAHCLDVQALTTPGEPAHRYRFKPDAPPGMLHRAEQIVAECLGDFTTFPAMLKAAAPKIRRFYRVRGRNPVEKLSHAAARDPVGSNSRFAGIMARAMETNAITYQVQPPGC